MLTFQKSFLWLSKGFCLIFFPAIFACHRNLQTHVVIMKNIFTRMQSALLPVKDKIFKIINIFIMKNIIHKRPPFKPQYGFVVLLMLLNGPMLFAQNNYQGEGSGIRSFLSSFAQQDREENLVLSFSSPFSYTLGENVSWELKDESGSVLLSGKGDVSGYVFSKPGSYTLDIHEVRDHDPNSCEHVHFPEKLNIKVKPAKVDFDFSTIQFSKDVPGGQPANGIIISVTVNYSSYDNSTAIYKEGVTSFGVGSTVSGKLKNGEATLKPGANTLEFVLEGQAEAGNNIQLNFTDFNGEVQPYTLTPKTR